MTEQEAKTKWCPFSRVPLATEGAGVRSGAPVVNRSTIEGAVEANSNCIGSACMAWRELPVEDNRPRNLWSKKRNEEVTTAYGDDAEWRLVNPDEPLPPAQGWCGLAGKS